MNQYNGKPGMILNGLKGADLVIYNLLCLFNGQLRASEMADVTCYHTLTVLRSLKRLEDWGLIKRNRERPGQRYSFTVRDDHDNNFR